MLAKVHIHLPFELTLTKSEYQLYTVHRDGYEITIGVPCRELATEMPVPSQFSPTITIDGHETVQCNTITLVFKKDRFRTASGPGLVDWDPPAQLIQWILDFFVTRIRYVTNAAQIVRIEFPNCRWRIEYEDDQGLEQADGQNTPPSLGSVNFNLGYVACEPARWKYAFELPIDFEPQPWRTLLIDASGFLDHPGTAIVLASTALEVFIGEVLEALAKADSSQVKPGLWKWINNRDHWTKDPSVDDQFDTLLRELAGHSLKERNDLWEAFRNLKSARNSFVHEGSPLIGRQRATKRDAAQLLAKAQEIVVCVREWLPESIRWGAIAAAPEVKVTIRTPWTTEELESGFESQ